MRIPTLFALACASLIPPGCKGPDAADTGADSSSGVGPSSTSVTSATSGTSGDPTTTAEPTSTSTGGGSSSGPVTTTGASDGQTTGGPGSTTGSSGPELTTGETTGGGVCVPLSCDGATYACGDCIDNDADGLFDGADPECISPCDDREDTFATGLPGDNMDPCKQDCFFDGNSGGGKGDCAWNLACDPKGPGGDKCPYDPKKVCPAEQSQECIDSCQVPNGCDCFGCCTVSAGGTVYDVFIGDKDCSLANIDTCEQCTKNDDCDDACNPDNCELCFGQSELPDGCDMPTCDSGVPCKVDKQGGSNCAEDEFCSTGCCAPILPG